MAKMSKSRLLGGSSRAVFTPIPVETPLTKLMKAHSQPDAYECWKKSVDARPAVSDEEYARRMAEDE